jgi:hypothetical protein
MFLAAIVPRSVDLGLLIFDLFEVGGSSSILFPKAIDENGCFYLILIATRLCCFLLL